MKTHVMSAIQGACKLSIASDYSLPLNTNEYESSIRTQHTDQVKFARRTFVPGHGQPPVPLTVRAVRRRRCRGITQSAEVITRPCAAHCTPALTAGTFPSSKLPVPVIPRAPYRIFASPSFLPIPTPQGPHRHQPEPTTQTRHPSHNVGGDKSPDKTRRLIPNRRQGFIPIPRPFRSVPPGQSTPPPPAPPPAGSRASCDGADPRNALLPPADRHSGAGREARAELDAPSLLRIAAIQATL